MSATETNDARFTQLLYEEQLRRQRKDAELNAIAFRQKQQELDDVLNSKWWKAAKPLRRGIFLVRYVLEHARMIGKPRSDAPPSDAIPPSPLLPLLDQHRDSTTHREAIDRMLEEQSAWRILLVSPDLDPDGTGGRLYRMAEALRGFGHDALLLAVADGAVRAQAEKSGLPVVVAPELMSRTDWLGIASPFNLVVAGGMRSAAAVQALNSMDIPLLWWLDERTSYNPQDLLHAPELLSEDIHVFAADEAAKRLVSNYRSKYSVSLLSDAADGFAQRVHETVAKLITRMETLPPDLRAKGYQLEQCSPVRPRVSVVIPAYNAGSDGERLLSALERQTGLESLEIVVIDSGSKDDTVACCKRHGVRLIEIPNELFSHSFSRNLGARYATGDILLVMTQDALPTSDTWVKELIAPILRQEASAVSPVEQPPEGTDLYYVISSEMHKQFCGTDKADQHHYGLGNGSDNALHRYGALNDVATAIRRDVFLRFLYRHDFGEDLDMGLRLLRGGYRISLLHTVSVAHGHNRAAGYYVKRSLVGSVIMQERIQHIPTVGTLPEKVVSALLAEGYGAMQLLGARLQNVHCDRAAFEAKVNGILDELSQLSAQQLIDAPPCPALKDAIIDDTIAQVRAEIKGRPKKVPLSVTFIRQYLQYRFWPNFDACAAWDDETSPALVLDCLNKHFATLIGAELGCIPPDCALTQRIKPLWRGV